jgi:inactivated superfamily I helicase
MNDAAWKSAFPLIAYWCNYANALPEPILSAICAARLGQAPAQVVVEQPWQAQWVKQQCMAYFALQGIVAAPMPHIMTLGQWQALDAQKQQHDELMLLTERQAALSLCNALKDLTVESIVSDSARYALAVDMVNLLKEMDTRAALSSELTFAGQDASARLAQTAWLSREAQWLAVAKLHLQDAGKPLEWQVRLQAAQRLAGNTTLTAVFPAPHPSLAMQAFLSAVPASSNTVVCLPELADAPACALRLSVLPVTLCEQFEQEAVAGVRLIQSLMAAQEKPRSVIVVAHDRVLARRCAALLARQQVPVEDRVGWALSTTVSSTVLRGLLTSWQGSDVPALTAWLALPIVAAHWPQAKTSLAYLRHRWHKEPILPEGREFMRQAIAKATDEAVKNSLQGWQQAQKEFSKLQTISQHACALQAYCAPLSSALLLDAAGAKVWQHLQNLAVETDANPVSMATFIAVLDEALESERFSASTHSYSEPQTARVIFVPLYEAAWTENATVVMLGCNEAHFPAAPRSPTPLLNSVRRELGLPLPGLERAVWQHLLAQSQQPIYATFTPSEQGNPSRLSPWLLGATITSIMPAAVLTAETIEVSTERIAKQAARLSFKALPTEISVTKLAAVLQCPYRFALEAVFGVKSLDEPAVWPAQAERGNLLHEALHLVKNDLQSLNNGADLEAQIKTALYTLLQDKAKLSGRYAALVADSHRTLATYVSAQTARQTEGWRLQATEHTIESQGLIDGVRVHGKLDRLDVMRDSTGEPVAYAVLDYKTSNATLLNKKRNDPLLDAQLALYAALLEQLNMPAAQAAYWRLHDGLHDANPSKAYDHSKKTIYELKELPTDIDRVQAAVRAAWQTLASSGEAPATPNESACQYCAYQAVCRSSDCVEDEEQSNDE